MTICGEAADGPEGIRKVFELKPGVILLDLSMPTLDGLKAAQRYERARPSARAILSSVRIAGTGWPFSTLEI